MQIKELQYTYIISHKITLFENISYKAFVTLALKHVRAVHQ